jgi:glycosyltransferase involved in cell wall biosynthesis
VGGAEIAIAEIAKGLPQVHFDIVTSLLDRNLSRVETVDNTTIYRLGNGTFLDKYWLAFYGARFATKELRKPDFIWGMMASYGGLAASFFKKKNPNISYLLSLQEGDSLSRVELKTFIIRPLFLSIFKRADTIQAISHYLALWAKKINSSAPVHVIPNGVPLSRIIYRPRFLTKKEIRLISVSRLVHKNGLDTLILSLQFLPKEITLSLVGEGPDEKKLKRLVLKEKLEDRVVFLGGLVPNKALRALETADMFIRPSRSEGLGNAFLEAMASGLITIGTPVGGIPDFLKDGETGFLVSPDDPALLARTIKKIKNLSLEEQKVIVENARKLVENSFSWSLVVQKMARLFNIQMS